MIDVKLLNIGCRTNQAELLAISKRLSSLGYTTTFDQQETAKVVVINSCTVTHRADRSTRQIIYREKRNGSKHIILCGCMVRNPESPLPDGTIILHEIGQKKINTIIDKIRDLIYHDKTSQKPPESNKKRPSVVIQEGCSRYCTYCIVPFVRGKSFSRTTSDILKDVKKFVIDGANEIVLTGTDLSSFKNDDGRIYELLECLCSTFDGVRFRLSSLEPYNFDFSILNLMGKGLCRHIHFAIQSLSDKILFDMKRDYTSRQILDLLIEIKKIDSNITIGADIIVGFPTEDENAFIETLQNLNKSPIDYLHVFTYSRRPMTPAANIKPLYNQRELNERKRYLLRFSNKRRYELLKRTIKRVIEVIPEKRQNGYWLGTSSEFVRCKLYGNFEKKGILKALSIGVEDARLLCRPLEEN